MSAYDWHPDPDPLDATQLLGHDTGANWRRPAYLKDWVGPSEFAFRRREWRWWLLLALGVGAALGFVAGWALR